MARDRLKKHPSGKAGEKIEERSGLTPKGEGCPERAPEMQPAGEAGYQALIDTLPVAVIVVRDGRIIFANPTAAEILGFPQRDDLIGLDPMQFVAASEKERISGSLDRMLSSDAEVAERVNTLFLHADSREFPAEVRVRAFDVLGSAPLQMVFTDLTERKHFR